MNPGARRTTPSMNPISMSRSRSCSRVSFFDRFGGMSNVTTADDYTQNRFKSSGRKRRYRPRAQLDTTTKPVVDSLSPRRRSGERVREMGFQKSATIRWNEPLSPAPLVPRRERGHFSDGGSIKMRPLGHGSSTLSRNDAVGLGDRARLARSGRRTADKPGRQLPAPLGSVSAAAKALGGTPRTATETVALPFSIASFRPRLYAPRPDKISPNAGRS